jgi:hypothetical protein
MTETLTICTRASTDISVITARKISAQISTNTWTFSTEDRGALKVLIIEFLCTVPSKISTFAALPEEHLQLRSDTGTQVPDTLSHGCQHITSALHRHGMIMSIIHAPKILLSNRSCQPATLLCRHACFLSQLVAYGQQTGSILAYIEDVTAMISVRFAHWEI